MEVVTTIRRDVNENRYSAVPQHINPIQESEHPLYTTTSTTTTVTKKSKKDGNKDSTDGRRSKKLPLLIREQILSMQDYGCFVDLGHGRRGFCCLQHVTGTYRVLEDDDDDHDDDEDDRTGNMEVKRILQGRSSM